MVQMPFTTTYTSIIITSIGIIYIKIAKKKIRYIL